MHIGYAVPSGVYYKWPCNKPFPFFVLYGTHGWIKLSTHVHMYKTISTHAQT